MSLPAANLGFWLAKRAQMTPGRVALETPDGSFTYAELDERAARCANALHALGIGPGDRVGVLADNGVEYVDLLFACALTGAILVPLSTRLAPSELEFMCNDAGMSVLVYDAMRAETVKSFMPQIGVRGVLAIGDADHPSYDAALSNASSTHEPVVVSFDDVLAIFYTSGTTGRPKGAMLTHGNFFWTNLNALLSLDITQDERSLVVLPMFHVGGWNVNTLAVLWKGGTVVLERGFDPGRAIELFSQRGITSFMGVPTIYQMIADHPDFDRADLSSLRFLVCGGAPLPVPLIRRYQDRGVSFIQGYGLTETAPNALVLAPEDAVRKAGAAGKPYFFMDIRLTDADGAILETGGTGEIAARGPSVMKGYWRRPEETAKAIGEDGWLRTGDVGRIDDEGYISIVDRVKDMYISGGENVYPAEVEMVLASHPAIAEVAVIGVPDDRWGEVGRAIVVLREGADATAEDITAFCAERLAKFKVPASVVFADSLPRNPTGKLLKPELRARYGGDA